jgi:hypothetical protein
MARNRDLFGPPTTAPKPRSDAYTGLLAVSLVAMIIGCTLLYLDYQEYGETKPPPVPAAAAKTAPPAEPMPMNPGQP